MTHAAAPLAAGSTPASSGDGSPAAVSRRSDRLSGGGDGRGASGTRPPISAARRFLVALVHAAALAALLVLPSGAARADAPRPPRDAAPAPAPVPAFPGAEGFGAGAKGGRGGAVCEVTNLNDGGPGSLRDCVGRSGPRTVVFRVGGTITLNSVIRITEPFVTIAGQTAPGGGITLRKGNYWADLVEVDTHDVVIRFIRLRAGKGGGQDGITVGEGGRRVVLDHLSVSWAVDENISTVGDGIPGTDEADVLESSDVTIQWSISSEALNCAFKGKCHSKGLLAYGNKLSFHHNLFAHNSARNPQSDGGDVADYVNNVVYNWGWRAARFYPENMCIKINFVGNYFKPGPNGIPSDPPSTRNKTGYEVDLLGSWPQRCPGFKPIFLRDNVGRNRSDASLAESLVVEPRYRGLVAAARWDEAPQVRTTSAAQAFEEVLQHAGASVPTRDAVDERVLRDVRNGTGRIIDDVAQVGGWPRLAAGTPPQDGDDDGMPDTWEIANGLDPRDAADRNGDADGDGYTNLEEHLNGLVAAAFPPGSPARGLDGG